MTATYTTCRYLTRDGQCTGEALSDLPDVPKVCARHAANILDLIAERAGLTATQLISAAQLASTSP